MRLLSRERGGRPPTKNIRPRERYLMAGVEEARRLGCGFVGTKHVLLALARGQRGGTCALLARLGVDRAAIESALAPWLGPSSGRPKIDPDALASLGIDFKVVRARIEETFGQGALGRTSASCLGIAPRLELALAHALDHAGDSPLRDEHVLLGFLSVPDSVAARALAKLGVSTEGMQAMLLPEPPR
jgi:ATP-dependent Clp protease ATP-binding subunit ClpA